MCGCCKTKPEYIQTAAVANGNGEVFDVLGRPAVSFQVFGTIAGGTDVAFEFLTGLSTWAALPVTNASDGTVTSSGIVSAAGTYIANTTGLQKVRARVLNYGGADSINVVATTVCEGSGTTVVSGEVTAVTTQPTRTTASIAAAIQTDAIMNGLTVLTPKFAVIDHAASGDNTIVAAVPTKKIRVLNVVLIAAGTVNVRFESGAGGAALTGQMQLTAQTGFAPGEAYLGHFETAAGALLNLELSAAVSVAGWLVYVEV